LDDPYGRKVKKKVVFEEDDGEEDSDATSSGGEEILLMFEPKIIFMPNHPMCLKILKLIRNNGKKTKEELYAKLGFN